MTTTKTTRRLTIPLIAAILIVLVPAGCIAVQASEHKTLSTSHLTLKWINKAQAGERIEKLILQHPLPISERELALHMAALNYESLSPRMKARPVFTQEDIQKTRHLFTLALNKAHPQNIIGFEVDSKAGTIKGHLFASGGNLHWRFFEIEGLNFSLTLNMEKRYGTVWQIAPNKDQKFHATDEILGKLQLLNWVKAKIDSRILENMKMAQLKKNDLNPRTAPLVLLPQPILRKSSLPASKIQIASLPKKGGPGLLMAQSAPSPSQPSPPKPNPPKMIVPKKSTANLEEILRALKNLYDHQRMDKQEYELKREILIKYL